MTFKMVTPAEASPLGFGVSAKLAAMSDSRVLDLINTALEVQARDAQEAHRIGFMPRVLVQTTMPYRDPKVKIFERRNGDVTMTMLSPHGVPFGSIPRYLVSYLASEAVRTQSPHIYLGRSLNSFIQKLDMNPEGGAIPARLKTQARKFLTTTLSVSVTKGNKETDTNILIASKSYLAWNTTQPDQPDLWESCIALSDEFFKECTSHAVPIDMRVMDTLRPSPMAMDVYVWLTYRIAIARQESFIPWELLMLQFGSKDATEKRTFVRHFLRALRQVETAASWHPSLAVEDDGIIVYRGKPHVKSNK